MKELLIIFAPSIAICDRKQHVLSVVNSSDDSLLADRVKEKYELGQSLQKDVFIFDDNLLPYRKSKESANMKKYVKIGSDEGERMFNAFLKGFIKDYTHIVLIRSVHDEIDKEIISEAFAQLKNYDYVLGPLKSESYYLIAMKKLDPFIFDEHSRKSEILYCDIVDYIKNQHATLYELPELKETAPALAQAI